MTGFPGLAGKNRAGLLAGLGAFFLLAVFLVRGVGYISYSSPTYDEAYYAAYGASLLETGQWRLAADKPNLAPLLAAIPLRAAGARFDTGNRYWRSLESAQDYGDVWLCALDFLHKNVLPADRLIFYARLPGLLLGLLTGLAVYAWSSRLYGRAGGLLSLFLFASCPNI
ncbi:MAG: hypothetical protein NDI60_11105, partial [Elusimicrobiales bacterium]|nr:hypothetical protein [Elusimicrobiales bacterium]